jgi:arylsulfatase A-like enzyme
MSGGNAARWKDEDFPEVLLKKATTFITENKSKPFFLYFSLSDIHVPRDPNPMFKGKTTMGRRGDDIVQMDWTTGELMKVLNGLGLTNNTLVIFSSDNGPILNDGYDDNSETLVGNHKPAGPFNGGKYSAYEGGTRVPTIIHWPSKIKPGVSSALVNQVDFYASFAKLTGQQLGAKEAPDSYDILSALLGKSTTGRQTMLEESFTLAIRNGSWKYIAPQTKPTPVWLKDKDVATGLTTKEQLYNLKNDEAEKYNVIEKYPSEAKRLKQLLKTIKAQGTRPGYKK